MKVLGLIVTTFAVVASTPAFSQPSSEGIPHVAEDIVGGRLDHARTHFVDGAIITNSRPALGETGESNLENVVQMFTGCDIVRYGLPPEGMSEFKKIYIRCHRSAAENTSFEIFPYPDAENISRLKFSRWRF